MKWGTGRIGRVAKVFADEPRATTAWAKGSDGERRLGERLNRDLADVGVVLHDRKVSGTKGNLDHLVVAPSGIWIIDAKNYSGKVECRDVGGWFKQDLRLYVANRDQTKLVHSMGWQEVAVRKPANEIGFGELPIRRAICFTNAEWPLIRARPFVIDDVLVSWAGALVEKIDVPGPLGPDHIRTIATHLSERLPASRTGLAPT